MFDVIHVIYEEDITPLWEQHIDVKDRVREAIYPMLYNRPYLFSSKKGTTEQGALGIDGSMELPEENVSRETKPFIPVTDPEDLMKALDAPMGG